MKDGRIKREASVQRDRTKQIAKATAYLYEKMNEITHPVLKRWCLEILKADDFRKCTASRRQHQAYDGGLLVHTAEVLMLAEGISGTPCLQVNMDIVTTAIIFHDIGKVYDYERIDDGHYEYTEHKELISHLSRSYAVFMSRTDPDLSEDLRMQIGHCILSHHGRKEWGSPVAPVTPEAYVVHCADWISADATVDYWE